MKNEPLIPIDALKQLKPLFTWANWIYKDESGNWYISAKNPELAYGKHCWIDTSSNMKLIRFEIAFDGDWRESLTSLEQEGE